MRCRWRPRRNRRKRMIENSRGLVMRTRPLTETSLIVHWLTPDLGRLATVAKGARRPKSPYAGKLDLFYLADFSFTRSRRSDLHTLREVNLRETHGALREDFVKLQHAAYATACLELATETDTPLPEIYELTSGFLDWLCRSEPQVQSIFAFELKLLHELGLEPDLEESRLAPGTRKIATTLAEADWETIGRIKLSADQTRDLREWLHGFLVFHLERLPRGRAAVTH